MKKFAIFFPQFHQIKTNDSAWGYGFNDWHLVSHANAFSKWQKRAPRKGFYDLSNNKDIEVQFSEASSYGLDGFGIYHYFFKDGPELNKFENYVKSNSLPENFKFFLIWANENWSTRWSDDVKKIKEVHSDPSQSDVNRHVEELLPLLKLSCYEKFNQKLIFIIYRPDIFKDIQKTLNLYKKSFQSNSLEVSFGFFIKNKKDIIYQRFFDFCYIFEPRLFQNFYGLRSNEFVNLLKSGVKTLTTYENSERTFKIFHNLLSLKKNKSSYEKYQKYLISHERKEFFDSLEIPFQEVLNFGWDNTPRYRSKGIKIVDVPSVKEVRKTLENFSKDNNSKLPLLSNAWNEWSEGAAIEPCHYLGDYLLTEYLKKY